MVIKKILFALVALMGLAASAAVVGLVWAHRAILRERVPLPAREEIAALAEALGDAPVRVWRINTASQPMPRGAVLDPNRDRDPDRPYVMSHPSFVLEWADGRILLIDAGMTRDAAVEFGKPLQWLAGAQPIEPHGSSAEQLADRRSRVQGIIFTHLHMDHVESLTALCDGLEHPVRVFQTEAQAERPNYTTRAGLKLLHAQRDRGCVEIIRLGGAALLPVDGFPGVFVIAAGGHTPGSQLVVAFVKANDTVRRFVFTGDTVNHIDGVTFDMAKPYLYRLLMVPEDDERQTELRRFLRRLRDRDGFTLLVSHDELALQQSGVPAWVAH